MGPQGRQDTEPYVTVGVITPSAPATVPRPRAPGHSPLAAAGIVLGAVVLVVLAGASVVRTRALLTPASREAAAAKAATYDCLERRVEAAVPAGARVHFARDRAADPGGEWLQRAMETTYHRYDVVAGAAAADYVVGFGPATGGCPALQVRRTGDG